MLPITLNSVFYYWSLLGANMKTFIVKSILGSSLIMAADTILSLYPVLLMYISYQFRLSITSVFWSVLLLQTGYCAFKLAAYEWSIQHIKDRKRILVYLSGKHAVSLISRLKNNASHDLLQSEEIRTAHIHLARMIIALRRLISVVYTAVGLLASMICIAIISLNFSILCSFSLVMLVMYTPGWVSWNARSRFYEAHRIALHTYSTVMSDVFANLNVKYNNIKKDSNIEEFNEFVEGVTDSLSEAVANKHSISERDTISAGTSLVVIMAVLLIVTLFIFLSNFQYVVYTITWFACSYWRFNENVIGLLISLDTYSEAEFDFGELELLYRETYTSKKNNVTHILTQDFIILFRALEFSRGQLTLRQVDDVLIGAGDIISIEGLSGSGKSTLFDIITGKLNPIKCEVYLDNTILSGGFNELQSNIIICSSKQCEKPYVHCDVYAFIGGGNADHSAVISCLRAAEVSVDFLDREICRDISDGEWQRLLIARCLYQNKRIMVLDDIDTNIDVNTAIAIVHNIQKQYPHMMLLISTKSTELRTLIGIHHLVIDSGACINFV